MDKKLRDFYKKYKVIIDLLIIVATFVVLYIRFNLKKFEGDDLRYMMTYDGSRPIESIKDVYEFQKIHYMEWGGRSVAHTILQLLIITGKPWLPIINTIAYMGLAGLMNLFIKKRNIFTFIGFLGSIWFFHIDAYECVFGLTGACNYMYTSIIILIAVIPFFRVINDEKLPKIMPLFYPLALMAGWTNENMAPTMILLMIFVNYLYYKKNNKINIHLVIMTVLAIVGCCLMILAPGNFVRTEETIPSSFMGILYRGHGQVNAWFNWLLMPIGVLAVLIFIIYDQHKKLDLKQTMLFVWIVLSILIMIASPSYPSRATFGSFLLMLILIFDLVETIIEKNEKAQVLMCLVCAYIWLGLLSTQISFELVHYANKHGANIPS